MRSNSLGFATEIVPAPRTSTVACDIEEAQPRRRLAGMSPTACVCCVFTTALVLSAVGVGVWFAVTEL